MKLVRYGAAGKEKPGIIDSNGKIRDLSKIVKDINGEALSPAGLAKIKKAKKDKIDAAIAKLDQPPTPAEKLAAAGLTVADLKSLLGLT